MRISDWSSDVCSSDLFRRIGLDHFARPSDPLAIRAAAGTLHRNFQGYTTEVGDVLLGFGPSAISTLPQGYAQNIPSVASWRQAVQARDRRGVVEGKSVHVRVDLGGRRIIKKTNKQKHAKPQ